MCFVCCFRFNQNKTYTLCYIFQSTMPLILPLTLSSLQEWSREIGEARKLVLFVLFVDVVTESPKLLHVAHKMDLHRCVVWKVKWTLEILSPFLNSQYDSACSISQLPVWQRMLHFSTHSMTAHAPFLNSQYDSACSISQLPVWQRMLHPSQCPWLLSQ